MFNCHSSELNERTSVINKLSRKFHRYKLNEGNDPYQTLAIENEFRVLKYSLISFVT